MAKRLTALAFVALLTAGFAFAQDEQNLGIPGEVKNDPYREEIKVDGKKLAEDARQPEQKLEISGEVKTGFYWEETRIDGKRSTEDARMHNNDDAGTNQGRFRMNMHLHNENNMGMKIRYEQQVWTPGQFTQWAYALAYGNFIDNQLRVTVGKLGESPWSAGGPDIWEELDDKIGIRTEIMPNAVPGLDFGFVLGAYNEATYNEDTFEDNKLIDMLKETVLGISYSCDFFLLRFSWRLDGDLDNISFSTYNPGKYVEDNMSMMYRLEERIIRKYLPGFSIWANGFWKGIGEDKKIDPRDSSFYYRNWLYIDYSPAAFSSQLRFGYHAIGGLQTLIGRASFYYNILPVLSAGLAGNYRKEIGENAPGEQFLLWGVEPQIRVTFNPNAYIAFVYNFEQRYVTDELSLKRVFQDRQWINLRVVYTF